MLISINFALFFSAIYGIVDAGIISPVVPIKRNMPPNYVLPDGSEDSKLK